METPSMKYPEIVYLSNEAHTDQYPLQWDDFRRPKLRRFAQDVKLGEFLDRGIQGAVFKSSLGNGTQVAVKVFFEPERPETECNWWPFELECLNAATLHMMRARCDQLEREGRSIYLIDHPVSSKQALLNVRAFSDEHLATEAEHAQGRTGEQKPFNLKVTTPRCYGWTELPATTIMQALRRSRMGQLDNGFPRPSKLYPAIVYEFVPKGQPKKETIDAFMDFLRVTGFCNWQFREDNWHGDGVLVDHGDIVTVIKGPPNWPPDKIYARLDFKKFGLGASSALAEGSRSEQKNDVCEPPASGAGPQDPPRIG